jgi:hypothetical protein
LPRGSRPGDVAARCEAPMTATDLGAIKGVRSRQTLVFEFSASKTIDMNSHGRLQFIKG